MLALVKKETLSEPDTVGEDLHKFFSLSTIAVLIPRQFSELCASIKGAQELEKHWPLIRAVEEGENKDREAKLKVDNVLEFWHDLKAEQKEVVFHTVVVEKNLKNVVNGKLNGNKNQR